MSTLAEEISIIPRKQTKFKHLYKAHREVIVTFKINIYFE